MNPDENIPKARKLGKPIYEITSREVNGLTLFVAGEFDQRGVQKGIYPVTQLDEIGLTRMLWIDGGPAGAISWNAHDVDKLICEIESLPIGSFTNLDPRDPKDFINGFRMVRTTGRRKSYEFEFPFLFYYVKVNESLNFLEYDRLKKQIDKINSQNPK